MAESVYDIIAKFNFQVEADPLKLILNDLNKLITLTKTQEEAAKKSVTHANVNAKATLDLAKAKEVELKIEKEIQKTIEVTSKARKKEEKDLETLTNDYAILSKASAELQLRAKNLNPDAV